MLEVSITWHEAIMSSRCHWTGKGERLGSTTSDSCSGMESRAGAERS